MRLIHNILALLAICLPEAQAAAPGPVRITVGGESGSFVLPLNQPVGTWTKIYGMGFHNAAIPASMGWAMSWTFQRVTMFATFTGQPLVATEAGITPIEGQPGLSPAEAAAIAHSLGLNRSQPDPNMPGATLWPGEHLNLRYRYVETSGQSFLKSQSFLEIWTDQFPDPSGIWPEHE
jgi:hypothetical protein